MQICFLLELKNSLLTKKEANTTQPLSDTNTLNTQHKMVPDCTWPPQTDPPSEKHTPNKTPQYLLCGFRYTFAKQKNNNANTMITITICIIIVVVK